MYISGVRLLASLVSRDTRDERPTRRWARSAARRALTDAAYSGGAALPQQQRFTVERATLSVDRLPVASTCFNTLKLPPYPSAQALAEKLRLVFWAEGFHEGAIAM